MDPDSPKKALLLPDKKLHEIDKFCESCWKACPLRACNAIATSPCKGNCIDTGMLSSPGKLMSDVSVCSAVRHVLRDVWHGCPGVAGQGLGVGHQTILGWLAADASTVSLSETMSCASHPSA